MIEGNSRENFFVGIGQADEWILVLYPKTFRYFSPFCVIISGEQFLFFIFAKGYWILIS